MTVGRATEITSYSTKSLEDAIEVGFNCTIQRLQKVERGRVQEQKVTVENGKIATYQVNLQGSFDLID